MTGLTAYKLWRKYFRYKYLLGVFEEKLKNRTSIGLDWISSENFENTIDENINVIIRKCNALTYEFTRYREILISKGANKLPRQISIPTIRDKLVLVVINKILTGVFEASAVTPMPQVIIDEIKQTMQNDMYDTFIKIDISSFYASIDHEILISKIKKRIKKKEVLHLLNCAIKTETVQPGGLVTDKEKTTGVPEGLSISNALANIYLHDVDKIYSENHDRYKYWRYVDDILVLTSKMEADSLKCSLVKEFGELGLKYNEGKSCSGEIKDGFEYLGYFLSRSLISVRKSSVVSLERALDFIFRSYDKSESKNVDYLKWKIDLKVTGFIIDNHKYGWLFFYSQINDLRAIAHLDWLVAKLSKRYNINVDIQFKKFIRSYNEISHALHTTSYIPNLDIITIEEKRNIVHNIYGEDIRNRNDDFVNGRFRRLMNREIRDIQKDVQTLS